MRHYFEAPAVSSKSSSSGSGSSGSRGAGAAALVLDPALLRGRVGLLRAGTPGAPPHYQVTVINRFVTALK
jgi:hypothetical protein